MAELTIAFVDLTGSVSVFETLGNDRAARRHAFDQAIPFQAMERFADWRAAHAEPAREKAFLELLAGLEREIDDSPPDLQIGLSRETAAARPSGWLCWNQTRI